MLLAGLVALAHRIMLLLLSGFVASALLLPRLLAWTLLAGALVLLARILVLLLRHLGETPLLDVSRDTTTGGDFGCFAEPGSSQVQNGRLTSEAEITPVQAFLPRHPQLQPPVSSCYKTGRTKGLPGPEKKRKQSLE